MIRCVFENYRVTISIALIATAAFLSPDLSQAMQLDLAAIDAGQWWRIWTGHVTHFGGNHLAWDLLMFIVLGAACERRHPDLFAIALLLMLPVISGIIGLTCPEISIYRGLSGIDTGLFVWLVADQCRECYRNRDRISTAIWIGLAVGLIGKLLYEAGSGHTLFVQASHFRPLVESHLAGAVIGLLCSQLVDWRSRRVDTSKRLLPSS